MSERNLTPVVRLPNLVRDVAARYQVRGPLGNYLGFSPFVQPTIDIDRLLIDEPGEGPGEIPPFTDQYQARRLRPFSAALRPQIRNWPTSNITGTQLMRVKEQNDAQSPVLLNKDFFQATATSAIAQTSGFAWLSPEFQATTPFPIGSYHIDGRLSNGVGGTEILGILALVALDTNELSNPVSTIARKGVFWPLMPINLRRESNAPVAVQEISIDFTIEEPLMGDSTTPINAVGVIYLYNTGVIPSTMQGHIYWRRYSTALDPLP